MRHRWDMNVLNHWHIECLRCGAKIRCAELDGGPRGGRTFDVQASNGEILHNLNQTQVDRWKAAHPCQEPEVGR